MDISELWTAILSGHYHLAKQMISRGANVNQPIKTEIGSVMTLLHYAVATHNVRCIRVLAHLGANFNARASNNDTPLHLAVSFDAGPDVVELLINEGAVVDARGDRQFTPLHMATIANSIELAKTFITRGASVNAVNEDGCSILHYAVVECNLKIVKMLISHRVTIDAKDNDGYTPLHLNLWKKKKNETKIVSTSIIWIYKFVLKYSIFFFFLQEAP